MEAPAIWDHVHPLLGGAMRSDGQLGMGGAVRAHVTRGRRRPLPWWRRAWTRLKGVLTWR